MGSTSAGKSTFLMRLPPEISDPAASINDAENHVQGSSPQNMKTANGLVSLMLFGMM